MPDSTIDSIAKTLEGRLPKKPVLKPENSGDQGHTTMGGAGYAPWHPSTEIIEALLAKKASKINKEDKPEEISKKPESSESDSEDLEAIEIDSENPELTSENSELETNQETGLELESSEIPELLEPLEPEFAELEAEKTDLDLELSESNIESTSESDSQTDEHDSDSEFESEPELEFEAESELESESESEKKSEHKIDHSAAHSIIPHTKSHIECEQLSKLLNHSYHPNPEKKAVKSDLTAFVETEFDPNHKETEHP